MQESRKLIELRYDKSHPRTNLKGYKLSIKDFRKNIILKTRGKKNRSESSIAASPRRQTTITNLTTTSEAFLKPANMSRSRMLLDSGRPRIGTILRNSKQEQQKDRRLEQRKKLNENERMHEYIYLLLKKKEQEDQKQILHRFQREEYKKLNKQPKLTKKSNFCRRLKANSMKIKIRDSRERAVSQTSLEYETQSLSSVLQKIKKTQFYRKKAAKSSLSLNKTQIAVSTSHY